MNTLGMAIFTKGNTLMVFQKALVNMNGAMGAFTKVISSKGFEVATECGIRAIISMRRVTKDTIPWIRRLDMAFTSGKMDGFTKETFKMIIEMATENFSTERSAPIEGIG